MSYDTFYEAITDSPCPEIYLTTFIFLTSIFFVVVKLNLVQTPKQLSWVLTLITATILCISSIPFLYELYSRGGDLSFAIHETYYSRALASYFLMALTLDLILGSIYYLPYLDLLTGWVHHIAYILILLVILKYKITTLFCFMCPMELPTLFLALGSINKKLRNDYLFGASFLITRILYHLFSMVYWYRNFPKFEPCWILVILFPLHLFWFRGFVIQQKRLWQIRKQFNNEQLNQPKPVNETTPLNQKINSYLESNLSIPIS